jgi:hypothetical protein
MNTAKYTGMSLTERLTKAGLLEKFSKALREKDEATTLILLTQVELTSDQARDTLRSLLLEPNSFRNFR